MLDKTEVYVVQKYAGDRWNNYYRKDPKLCNQDLSHSAAFTYTGKQIGLLVFYTSIEEANTACDEMNRINPTGSYAVCKSMITDEQLCSIS